MRNNVTSYLVIVLLVVSCTTDGSKEDVIGNSIWEYPGVYEVDSVVNIQAYFDSLYHQCGADVWTHNPETGESIEVWNAVKELHRYMNGQRSFYPVQDIGRAIGHMAFEQGYCFSHSGEDSDSVNAGEAFMFRFMEQAALHSPQIEFITNFHAEGGEAGILYYPEWSTINPLYSFLVYKTCQGFKMLTIGRKGDVKINKIFRLNDRQGRIYYLCSNNDDTIYFRQFLYGWDSESMTLLCQYDGVEWDRYDEGYKIVFNPQKLRWDYCYLSHGVYRKVPDTESYELVLDWKNSRIRECD